MSEIGNQTLTGVAETLLIPIYIRAIESQRPDALLKDDKAVALIAQMDSAFSRIKQIRMDKEDQVALVLRNREFDQYARSFLARYPEAVVVSTLAAGSIRASSAWTMARQIGMTSTCRKSLNFAGSSSAANQRAIISLLVRSSIARG